MRKYYIDWLRIFGIFLLFPFHTARVFDYWESFYVKADPNWLSSWFIVAVSFWFMPLLFLIAGFSSRYALEKRSNALYLKERSLRLLIPFIFGMLIIVPPQAYIARLFHSGYAGNYFSFLKSFFTDFSDLSGYFGTFTPAHLWFILYLFVIALVTLPLIKCIKSSSRFLSLLSKPLIFILTFIPLTLSDALPDLGGKNPFYYALIFLLGYIISSSEAIQKSIYKIKGYALLAAVPLTVLLLYLTSLWDLSNDFSYQSIIYALLRNLSMVLVLIALLGYGEKCLNKSSKVLDYLNKAAFPVYILHQTFIVLAAYLLIETGVGSLLSYLLIILLSLIASLACYEILRCFKVTRFIFGIKA